MKTFCLFVCGLFLSTGSFSQDTLYTASGKIIPGKVMEITPDVVKYKNPSNPDGPLYTINKSDVVMIQYKNGSKDVFSGAGTATSQNNQPVVINNNNNSNPGYSVPRPNVNVVVGTSPFFFGGWGGWIGWPRWGGYYHRSNYCGPRHYYGRRGGRYW